MSQVDGDLDIDAAVLWFCVGGKAQKRYDGLCLQFCLGGSCPPAVTLMPDPLWHWGLSSCCPSAGAQGSECVSPCAVRGPLRGEA